MTQEGLRISDQRTPVAKATTVQSIPRSPQPHLAPPATPATPTPSASSSSYTDTPNSQMRKVIASRLLESKVTIPALYFTIEVSLDEAASFRAFLLNQVGVRV